MAAQTCSRFANIFGKATTQGPGNWGCMALSAPIFPGRRTTPGRILRDRDTNQASAVCAVSQRVSGSVNYAVTKYLNLHTDILWTGEPRAVETPGLIRLTMPLWIWPLH